MTWRRVFITLGLLALIGIVAANFGFLSQVPELIRTVNLVILLLVVPIQLLGYLSMAKFYQKFLQLFDYKLALRRLFETSLALNFVNQAFPSAGIAGMSFLAADLSGEVPAGKSTLAQLGRYVFTYLSFLVILAAGFLLLFSGGTVDRLTVRIILLFIIVFIVVGLLLITLINQRTLAERLLRLVVAFANRVFKRLGGRRNLISQAQLAYFLREFYHGYSVLITKRGEWYRPLWFTLGANLAEIATIYVVLLAFGAVLNPGAVIAAYTLANIFSLAAFVTNGAGVYEATMIAALVALGQPLSLAFSVVLLYRLFNMAVFLPVGFYYYRKKL